MTTPNTQELFDKVALSTGNGHWLGLRAILDWS